MGFASSGASLQGRRAEFSGFQSWELLRPPNSNALQSLLDVRAGVPYQLILRASTGLGTDASKVRVRLVLPSAERDVDCHPGMGFGVLHIAYDSAADTPLDGVTPAKAPAYPSENSWEAARFPYSGLFEACYFSGTIWYHMPGEFVVKGADTNARKYWCVASPDFYCRLYITGSGLSTTWRLTLVDHASSCGNTSDFLPAFSRNYSLGTQDGSRLYYSVGEKQTSAFHTYKVCYCPGYSHDTTAGLPCTMASDYVQLAGLLYTTRVIPDQRTYPMVKWDLVVRCGAEATGGCPLTEDQRFRLVDPAEANNAPWYDASGGCHTAPQALSYFQPRNCLAPRNCVFKPTALSRSAPKWSGILVRPLIENHAQRPMYFDVCYCTGSCMQSENWFKVDQISTAPIQVLPDRMLTGQLFNFQIYGFHGGWTVSGDRHVREMKFLFDPDGRVTDEDCFLDPQDWHSISGHYCYSVTDCRPPAVSNQDGHTWLDVKVHSAGMYAVCYCDRYCDEERYWSFLKWQLVAGPYSKHSWEFSRGIRFALRVRGVGLSRRDRLRIIEGHRSCGAADAAPVADVDVPAGAPRQLGDPLPHGLQRLWYTFDGTLVTSFYPHGLSPEDYVSLSNVTSLQCGHCAELINSRPHKVIRVASSTEFVIQVNYPQSSFPVFSAWEATWERSSEVTFENISALVPATYRVCWGGNLPSVAEDFGALAGSLSVFEPPILSAQVHLTAVQNGVLAPIIISFATRHDKKYADTTGSMQLKVVFADTTRMVPGFSFVGFQAEVSLASSRQRVCGKLFKELWSNDPNGFPMPQGCFYHHTSARKEYSFLFSAKNGLKAGTHYQIVMDARAFTEPPYSSTPRDGVVQLWSMSDVEEDPYGVVEFGPAWLDRTVVAEASGSYPQLHAVEGLRIVLSGPEVELSYDAHWEVPIKVRAAAGTLIKAGALLRIFLSPLTQWDLEGSCTVACLHFQQTTSTCASPVCIPEAVVPSGPGSKRNILKLTFSEMDPISDLVSHTVVLSRLRLPPGGFFATDVGGELQAADGRRPSYQRSVGGLIYAKPIATGSVVSGIGDGEDRPFRGDLGNTLYARLILGASLWAFSDGDAGFEMLLPQGYRCVSADPAEADLTVLRRSVPQGRGEIGLDRSLDGQWLFSGEVCTYRLRRSGIIYAGSALFVKLTVNNPISTMQRLDTRNEWTVQSWGKGAPFVQDSVHEKLSRAGKFSDSSTHLRRNVPVLGKLTGTTASPMLLGAGQDRNWLSIFFTTEQGSPDSAPQLELQAPDGFGFLPRCVAEALPSYHYASMSSRRTGITELTHMLTVVHCEASKVASGASHLSRAIMTVSRYSQLLGARTYGLRVLIFNSQTYSPAQHDGFRLATRSGAGDRLDATPHTIPFLATDGEGPGTSFGVYRLSIPPGFFVVSLDNMLPYFETGVRSRIIIFPLQVPFDHRSNVDWRIIAPMGYKWDFNEEQFRYHKQDIMDTTADLPIARVPVAPALPPLNILDFLDNFHGAWKQTETYGLMANIRIPDDTPRSSINAFYLEFGYSARTFAERFAGASYAAPQVRALINAVVDYQTTNLAGRMNLLLIQVETITNLATGGGLVLEAPQGFTFEEICTLLDNPMRQDPFLNLRTASPLLCTSEVPFATKRPLLSIAVLSEELRAARYEFMINAQNPTWTSSAIGMTWSVFAYSNIALKEAADMAALVDAFPIEAPMRAALLINEVSYAKTQRDDHPGQRSFVTLAFELNSRPPAVDSLITVKAPLGFKFSTLCRVVVGDGVFGPSVQYPLAYLHFEAMAVVTRCDGSLNTARIAVKAGLTNLRRYAFRLEVFNPKVTPEHNQWTISFGGESALPFPGYRLWAFTEVNVFATHAARSTLSSETKNLVAIHFRPANTVRVGGNLAVTAPFGFRIPTECSVEVRVLGPTGLPTGALPRLSCHGAPQPTNTAEAKIAKAGSEITALEPYRMDLEVINPSSMPIDPGIWHLQSYAAAEGGYSNLLDVGEAASFAITEVFQDMKVAYPPYANPLADELELDMQMVLPHAIELGDAIELIGPVGYNFAVAPTLAERGLEYLPCRGFVRVSPAELPVPKCRFHVIRFPFQVVGIPLVPTPGASMTPMLAFSIHTLYPLRTLEVAATVFHGEHRRGDKLMSSKTVPGQVVTPRLQGLSIMRMDMMIAVRSPSTLHLAFSPSQRANALLVTTAASQGSVQDLQGQFIFSEASAAVSAKQQPVTIAIASRTNETLVLELALSEAMDYVLMLREVLNPAKPGRALWTLATFARPTARADSDWLTPANRRDLSENFVGPFTHSRITLDEQKTVLVTPYFDMDAVELSVEFHVHPLAIPPGQYLIFQAPFGYSLVDRSFRPGDGFPMLSGTVYVRQPATKDASWAYVVQVLSRIQAEQVIKFGIYVNTPRTPPDLALWEMEHSDSWLLVAAEDPGGQKPSASNDQLFPGFKLMASFGDVQVTPEPNGVTPRKRVTVIVAMSPRAALRSLLQDGSVHVRIIAPLGFLFDLGCLALTPNRIFGKCEGHGRIAVLTTRDATLPAGHSSASLWVMNAGITPSDNRWVLESFVDDPLRAGAVPSKRARQMSFVQGYAVRELLQATVGANTQRAAVTVVFVWFRSSHFLDVGGAVELHAPTGYELRCAPQVQYITLPPGSCQLKKDGLASAGIIFHNYLVLTLTMPQWLVYPNTAYEFAVSAVNPATAAHPNYWGLVLLNPRKEVLDATMTLDGYKLTDLHFIVESLLASTTLPAVVNYVTLTITFKKELAMGLVGHLLIRAPTTVKVLCQRFVDITGSSDTKRQLPLDPKFGIHGTRSCKHENSITLHLLQTQPLLAGSHVLKLGILNPGIRPERDYWTIELLPGVGTAAAAAADIEASNATGLVPPAIDMMVMRNWLTTKPLLQIQVQGFGIASRFAGPVLRPVPADRSTRPRFWCRILLLLSVCRGLNDLTRWSPGPAGGT